MSKSEIKVSIIIPVYKVEKYINRCMDSLINQTLEEIEIICVNDGSPDNCPQILREYEKNYPDKNIIVIDKENGGLYNARITGLEKVRGKYVGFVDADDYIALDYAEKLYNAAEKSGADITVCGFDRIDLETGIVYSTEMTQYAGKTIDMDKNPEDVISINPAVWNKLYKAELIKKMRVLSRAPKIFEDIMTEMLVYINAKKITFIKDSLYYYMVRSDSIMGTIKKEQVKATEESMLDVKNIYIEEQVEQKWFTILDSIAFIHLGISLMMKVSTDKTCNFKEEISNNRKYLEENFPTWKNNHYLNLSYCIKNKSNLKPAIIRIIYKLGLFRIFIKIYNFMINKLKIDIKW